MKIKNIIHLGLLLTLPSLLFSTAISVNPASAADDIVAANQKSELITHKVATAAELEQKVESIPGQKPVQVIAQNADNDTDEVNKIRQELLVEPLLKVKRPKQSQPTYSPGLSFAAPSAFGANMGDAFIGTSAATAGKERTQIDGSISVGVGLGDSQKLAGVELVFNNGSIRDFGSNGTFDLKAHRIFSAKGNNQIAVAGGWRAFAQYGNEAIRPSSVYGVVTNYSLLKPNDPVNKMPVSFSVGAGGGDFRQGDASTGVFAGVGVQVHPQVGVGLGWSGVGLNVGASFVPVPTLPLTITAQGADLTDNSPGGPVFVLSIGYGFNFLPK
ncbi:hypothetical protein MEO40_16120 [Dolichospermum sp. ST_sed1]|nr:hypothetical protein [Dolichospermum sp. ST_sed1]MDD1427730.1 hypothetical protein [Dolichospermum sp. ST_sed9]MDD1434088.1 hypothetical protein [Dolichospermum sp. ST_sed6]MDD1443398.1 hypothetical protein [Dolichospermum sp. ST_sed3]MDD1449555.1 hypothetical protein [Dolichospermum sp. ST_sed8]MDD1457674.1 hypothetical protein [Dolichospermum sp. ST_sed7]MDD1469461.1 hypothetical protein [Dolichospermum sp. ST_sed5]MDD1474745.1 hypothetical protein [Dolichospermum sp. ST_sed4]